MIRSMWVMVSSVVLWFMTRSSISVALQAGMYIQYVSSFPGSYHKETFGKRANQARVYIGPICAWTAWRHLLQCTGRGLSMRPAQELPAKLVHCRGSWRPSARIMVRLYDELTFHRPVNHPCRPK